MDSDEESDTTTAGTPATSAPAPAAAAGGAANAKTSPIPPSFTSIGSPEVPTHQELQQMRLPKGSKGPDSAVTEPKAGSS
jgi:protein phosphatase 2C family protein 2/3